MVHEAQEPCAREYNKGNRQLFLLYDLSSVKRPAFCEMFEVTRTSFCSQLSSLKHRSESFPFFFFIESFGYLDERIDFLMQKCVEELKSQGFEE